MSILKFTIKYANDYDNKLSFDDSQVELISSVDNTIIDNRFDGNIRKFYRFAHDLALDKDIIFHKRRYRDGKDKVLEVSYDRGRYIINKFNMESIRESRRLKLKKVALLGTIASSIAISGITINVKSKNEKAPIETDIDTSSIDSYINNLENENKIVVTDKMTKNDDKMNKVETEKIDVVNYSYEDRSNTDPVKSASRYDKYFEAAERTYGVDKNLLKAIMCQESGGVHLNYSKNGHAYGGMQIESINFGHTIHAYNFDKKDMEDETVSRNKITQAEYNIKVGAMILQYHLNRCDYDVERALQSYNFGEGNMRKLGNTNWKEKRSSLGIGDPEYIEHVFSFLPDNTVLTFKKKNGKIKKYMINNTKVKDKNNSNNKTK